MVVLRSENEIEGMKRAGDLAARALALLRAHVRSGVRFDSLDSIVEGFIRSEGGYPTYKGYRPSPAVIPYPATICTAVNEEIVHGIPGPRRLRAGDIVGVDVGATLGGWVGDTCYTYPVGEPSPKARKLLEVARECLEAGIAEVGLGKHFGDVGAAIEELAEFHGYGVVRELGGHGVGHQLHEEPQIDHFGHRGRGMRFREGMTLTIEPMINEGTPGIRSLEDGWTVVTADGRLSAQYEHTIAVTATGCEILTPWHLYMRDVAGGTAVLRSQENPTTIRPS
jgi:methionyl aminopeptidase